MAMLRTIALIFAVAALVGCHIAQQLSEVANDGGGYSPLNFPSEIRKGEIFRGSMTYKNPNDTEFAYIKNATLTVRLTGTNAVLGSDRVYFTGNLEVPPGQSRTINFDMPIAADKGSGSADVEVNVTYIYSDNRDRSDKSSAPLQVKD